jgi:arginase family enzyme
MNEYGAQAEYTVRHKLKYLEKNLLQFHIVHYKSHTDWHRTEYEPLQQEAGKCFNHGMAFK